MTGRLLIGGKLQVAPSSTCYPSLQTALPSTATFGEIGQAVRMRLSWRGLTPVVGLLFRCAPLAIIRGIWLGVIFPLNRCSSWSRPHIGVEVLKRIEPPLADSDASAAVSWIAFVRWIGATLLHCSPCVVLSGVPHIMRDVISVAMPSALQTCCVSPVQQTIVTGFSPISASAYTDPRSTKFMCPASAFGNYSQLAKYSVNHVLH